MKPTANHILVGVIVVGGALLVANQQAVTGANEPTPVAAKWEYQTESVPVAQLQAKLTALGAAGWDVFSITRSDSVIENANGGPAHIRSSEFQVTAKRR